MAWKNALKTIQSDARGKQELEMGGVRAIFSQAMYTIRGRYHRTTTQLCRISCPSPCTETLAAGHCCAPADRPGILRRVLGRQDNTDR